MRDPEDYEIVYYIHYIFFFKNFGSLLSAIINKNTHQTLVRWWKFYCICSTIILKLLSSKCHSIVVLTLIYYATIKNKMYARYYSIINQHSKRPNIQSICGSVVECTVLEKWTVANSVSAIGNYMNYDNTTVRPLRDK